MATEKDHSTIKHIVDENQYKYVKERFWKFLENEYFTDIKLITDKDVKYGKKVHGIILQCFCEFPNMEKVTENCGYKEKTLLLHHTTDMIEYIINLLYFGKCIVPVTALPQFMDLANFLKVSQISVYDERGSDYFVYLMNHQQKFLNYLYFIKKNDINCDMRIASMDFKCISVHSTILAAYSKKFFHCFRNRITEKNPVLLYLPMNAEKIGQTLEFCYFGQVTFAESDSNELSDIASILGIEKFLEKCKFSKRKCTLNGEVNDFRLVKPPVNSNPEVINKIKTNNSKHYVYLWIYNRCYVFPFLCVQLLNFLNIFGEGKENQFDMISFLKNYPAPLIKKFISCLYSWEYKNEIKPLIDLFGLKWSIPENSILSEYELTVNKEVVLTTLFASNLDDLRSICDKVFKEECHKGEKMVQLFTCQTCGEQSLSWWTFRYHCRGHRNDGHLCEECGHFIRPNVFFDHLARHKALRNNECKHCSTQFENALSLKRHQQRSNCRLEKCPECNKRIRKLKINEHIAKHRIDFQCTYCNQNFTSSQWLKRHILKQKFRVPVKCVHCKKSFVHKCHLKEHIHKDHNVLHTCPECSASFKTEGMLKKHFVITHTDKRVTCSFCDKVFTRFSSLKIHERFHSGEKPFKCKYCYKPYGRLDTLHYHIRNTHEKRKYLCPICKKNYSLKSYFLEHGLLIHQKSFDPDLCLVKLENPTNSTDYSNEEIDPQKEVDYSSWYIHKKMQTYNCPICRAAFKIFTDLLLHLDTHL